MITGIKKSSYLLYIFLLVWKFIKPLFSMRIQTNSQFKDPYKLYTNTGPSQTLYNYKIFVHNII